MASEHTSAADIKGKISGGGAVCRRRQSSTSTILAVRTAAIIEGGICSSSPFHRNKLDLFKRPRDIDTHKCSCYLIWNRHSIQGRH